MTYIKSKCSEIREFMLPDSVIIVSVRPSHDSTLKTSTALTMTGHWFESR